MRISDWSSDVCSSDLSTFRPHRCPRGPHAQTVIPTLLRPSPKLDLAIETLELPDGDFVRIGWAGIEQRGQRVAVLIHGLTGGFQSKYLRGLAQLLIVRGWRKIGRGSCGEGGCQ